MKYCCEKSNPLVGVPLVGACSLTPNKRLGYYYTSLIVYLSIISGFTHYIFGSNGDNFTTIPEIKNISSPFSPDSLPMLDQQANLVDVLRYAELNNPALKSAWEFWRSKLYEILPAGSFPDPKFKASEFIVDVETRVGPQEKKIGISQTFPWFGKRKIRKSIASAAAAEAKAAYEQQRRILIRDVTHVYYEYNYLTQAIEITKRNIQLLIKFEAVARAKMRTGSGLADVLKIQVELGKLEDHLRSLQDAKKPMIDQLNALLNRPIRSPFLDPKPIIFQPVELHKEEWHQMLLDTHPQLKILDYQIEKKAFGIALAKKNFYPDISLGLDYIITGESISTIIDNGKDPVIATISLNIPLWIGKRKAKLYQARSSYTSTRQQKVDTKNHLFSSLSMASYRFDDSERKILLFRDTLLPKAQQSLQTIQRGYETGKQDFLILIDAHRLLLEFELEYVRSIVNRMQFLARIEFLVGKITPNHQAMPNQ